MSVNSELSALLTKMGGTPLESDSNSDLIKKISNSYEGGGSGGGVTIVRREEGVLDKTAGEIFTAAQTGAVIVLTIFDNAVVTSELMTSAEKGKGTIHIFKVGSDNYVASSADDYPTISEE